MYRLIFSLFAAVLCLLPVWAEAQTYTTKRGHAEFHSEVPLHSFTGTSEHLAGLINLADSTVDFYLDLNTLETGISKRDKDMKRTLETEQYPFAEFYGKLVSDFNPSSADSQNVTVRGEFGLHGIKREVDITGTLLKTDNGLRLKASWTLNLNNYNVEPPGVLFYRVDEDQDIKINALLTPTDN